jgi:hypothetical protein
MAPDRESHTLSSVAKSTKPATHLLELAPSRCSKRWLPGFQRASPSTPLDVSSYVRAIIALSGRARSVRFSNASRSNVAVRQTWCLSIALLQGCRLIMTTGNPAGSRAPWLCVPHLRGGLPFSIALLGPFLPKLEHELNTDVDRSSGGRGTPRGSRLPPSYICSGRFRPLPTCLVLGIPTGHPELPTLRQIANRDAERRGYDAVLTADATSRIVDQVLLVPNSLCRCFRPSGSSSSRSKASTLA